MNTQLGLDTLLAQADHFIDSATGAVVPPVQPATTFVRDTDYELVGGYNYARYQSPNVAHAERLLARLDGGADAMLFSSGLTAITTVFETLTSGQHVVAPTVMYHGTHDWLRRISERRGIDVSLFEATVDGDLENAVRPGETAVVWIESPVNPTWDVIDIRATADVAHAAGAILAVDSTVAPPVTTRALDLGADLVFHSATKYLNGHSDLLAGVLVTREPDETWEEYRLVRKLTGGILAPFEAWLLVRGLRTLAVRFERCSSNALQIATWLEGRAGVTRVMYPGLESHPGHAIAKRQMTGGFGGMLSLLIDGDADAAKAVASRMTVFKRATSLGGVESLVEHRATVEGPHSTVAPNLLRLSVGLEGVDDLIGDLERAL